MGAEVVVCSEKNKNTKVPYGQKVQFLNVKPDIASSKHLVLKHFLLLIILGNKRTDTYSYL